MASGRCDQCGVEEYMPYVCKFCKGRYCAAHRLPENHDCQGLDAYKERIRAEGRVFAPAQEARVTPRVATGARAGASLDALWSKLDGKLTYIIMGICVAVYIVEFLVLASSTQAFVDIFLIKPNFLVQPWTIITSIFAHDPTKFGHLLVNMLVLLFFGQTTERLIGTRRFAGLFLVAGALAGIAQVLIASALFPERAAGALGASGAIQGVMGTLVILAPTLTVLVFFVIPAPLWALTAFYVVYDLLFNIMPGSGVAGIAHLVGLAIGIAYGYYLRKKGLRAVVSQAPPRPPAWSR